MYSVCKMCGDDVCADGAPVTCSWGSTLYRCGAEFVDVSMDVMTIRIVTTWHSMRLGKSERGSSCCPGLGPDRTINNLE